MSSVTRRQKLFVLSMLVLQNATQTLLMRYSRGVRNEKYHPSSVVLMTECCKLTVCSLIIFFGFGETTAFHSNNDKNLLQKITFLIRNSGYTWVPTTCYFIQNSLQYIASENLSSSVYAVLQQMKILSAAIASVLMLKKQLSWNKWRALLLLVCGGLLMEYHTFEMNESGSLSNTNDPVKGTAAILTIVGLSGFAGVMTQLLLKDKSTKKTDSVPLTIWDKNLQFAFWSIVLGTVSLFINTSWMSDGLFHGWTVLTIFLVFVWTAGGLLVAFTIKYTDVIVKGFASAISLILICINGWLLLNDFLDLIFIVGAMVTIIATFNYNAPDGKKELNSPIASNDNYITHDAGDTRIDIFSADQELGVLQPLQGGTRNTHD